MEKLWKLIENALETDLHDIASEAKLEWHEIKEKLESLTKEVGGEDYQPQEYPKMVEGKVAHNAKEEAAIVEASKPADPVPAPNPTE